MRHAIAPSLESRIAAFEVSGLPPRSPVAALAAPDTASAPEDTTGAVALPTYSASRAAFLGLILPGLGEFYADRPVRGGLLMAAAAGAVAAGVLVERVRVRCLSVPVDDVCPREDLASREVDRPYLVPALGGAAALAVIGALDAFVSARRANERATRASSRGAVGFSPRFALPTVTATPYDVRVAFLRVRF